MEYDVNWYAEGVSLTENVIDKYEDVIDLAEDLTQQNGVPTSIEDRAAFFDGAVRRYREWLVSELETHDSVKRGLEQSAAGDVVDLGDFTQFNDDTGS